MIIDCFPFFNELDLLEIRLNELSDVVDMFVLTEATLTHQGNKKPLYFDDNKSRFSDFNIAHMICDGYSGVDVSNPWAIEQYQRQSGIDFIKQHIKPDAKDVVLLADVDEIWRADKVRQLAKTEGWTHAAAWMPLFYYYMDCVQIGFMWDLPRWVKGNGLDCSLTSPGDPKVGPLRGCEWDVVVKATGWHFSYLGDVQEKLASFTHTEYNEPPYNTKEYIESRKADCISLFDSGKFSLIPNLGYLPRYVLENLDRFGKYLHPKGAYHNGGTEVRN